VTQPPHFDGREIAFKGSELAQFRNLKTQKRSSIVKDWGVYSPYQD
jgi:hypothetical protein